MLYRKTQVAIHRMESCFAHGVKTPRVPFSIYFTKVTCLIFNHGLKLCLLAGFGGDLCGVAQCPQDTCIHSIGCLNHDANSKFNGM